MVLIELGIKYKHIGHQHKLDAMVALGWFELGHKDILSEIPRGKFFAGLVQNAKFPISLIDVMHKCGRAAQGWFKERESYFSRPFPCRLLLVTFFHSTIIRVGKLFPWFCCAA